MDDTRTEETLDALADLFLTGTGTTGAAVRPGGAAPGMSDQLNGPAPIRLAPKRVPPPRRPESGDEPPRLRLRRDDEDHPEPSAAVAAPVTDDSGTFEIDAAPVEAVVEATLLGNLPGFGGPWLTQYAQLLADEHGPVVILHADDQRVDAELIQPGGSNALSGFEFAAAADAGDESVPVVEMLNVLLRLQPTPVRMILVNLLGDTSRSHLGAMRLWTLLTGTDDMATVAAYRLLKQSFESVQVKDGPPSLGLMLMGSDEAASRAAAAKINATASEFLKAPAPLVGHLQRMGPVNVKQLGSFALTPAVWPALAALFDAVMPSLPAIAAPVEVEAKVKPRIADAVRPPRPQARREPAAVVARPQPPIKSKAQQPPAPMASPRPAPAPEPAPVPAPAPAAVPASVAKPAAIGDDPDLASMLLDTAGGALEGVAIEARCPRHGSVQFMLDATGQLHLLKRHSFDRDGNGDGVRAALLELIEAEAWSREHRHLLALASRPHALNDAARPRLHLFTDRADLVTPLIGRTDLPLKLHLLQEVDLPTGSAWFCTPLS